MVKAVYTCILSGEKRHSVSAKIDIFQLVLTAMSEKMIHLNEEAIKGQIKELVRGSVEETLNELLEAEAEKLTQAARHERSEQRQGYRSGHYLTTTSGDVTLRTCIHKRLSKVWEWEIMTIVSAEDTVIS